jgi:hypothetical protein
MMTDDQILEVVAAHKEGKKIEFRYCCADQDGWSRWEEVLSTHMGFDFRRNEYRVAPELPKPREWIMHLPREGSLSGEIRVSLFPSDQTGHDFSSPFQQECIRVREVIGASSGNPTVASDMGSSIP